MFNQHLPIFFINTELTFLQSTSVSFETKPNNTNTVANDKQNILKCWIIDDELSFFCNLNWSQTSGRFSFFLGVFPPSRLARDSESGVRCQ